MKKCLKCGVELINRGSAAKFCEPCRIIRNKELDDEATERKRKKRILAMGTRYCENCNEVELSNDARQIYCAVCSNERDRLARMKHKRAKRVTEKRRLRNEMDDNFKRLDPSGKYLIPNFFDTISPIPSENYRRRFLGGWLGILKRHDKMEEFRDCIIEEYIEWASRTGSQAVGSFCKDIGVSKTMMDQVILGNELRELAGFSKYEYTEEECKEEFFRTLSCFEYIPFSTEFNKESKISVYRFAKKFKITGDVYIQLLQYYKIPQKDIDDMLERQRDFRSQMAYKHCVGINKIPIEDLIKDFRSTFDYYLATYNTTPSVEEFHRLAKYGKNTLVNRMEMSYSEVAESLGYDVDVSGSPVELVTLKGFESVLSSPYEPQAKFDWLMSDLGKNLRCDGHFKSYNLIVEFDGKQHFEMVPFFGQESFERTQRNDAIKNELIPKHGLTLIRIAYDEPYWGEDFLRMRLYENGIMPLNHTLVTDSLASNSKIAYLAII